MADLIAQARGKVILHWLGEAFDPALAGYWGARSFRLRWRPCSALIKDHAGKIDGIKISLLDAAKEVEMRRLLPDGVVMYTGDDFNYAELMAGDAEGNSHGLLGIFDPIAPAAAAALDRLAAGDSDELSTRFSTRPSRCRAASSRRRRNTTRAASSSWPG